MGDANLIIQKENGAAKKVNVRDTSSGKAGIRISNAPASSPGFTSHDRMKKIPQARIPIESFNDFINPKKKLDDVEEDDDAGHDDGGPTGDFDGGDFDDGFENTGSQGGDFADAYERPSAGFNTIEEEKRDIILKLFRLKSKGYQVSKSFTMQGDINDMRTELDKVKYSIDVDASIKFQRKLLIGFVNTIEFANTRWDPFDLALNGWSESVYDNVTDYDNVFERLWAKYKNKASLPPELELLITLVGSAFMFHVTQSMVKTMPAAAEVIRNNPNLMDQVMRAMGAAASGGAQDGPRADERTPPASGGGGQEPYQMKGPPMDIGKLTGMFGPINPPVTAGVGSRPQSTFVPKPPMSLEDDAMSDIMSDIDSIPASDFTAEIKKIVIDGSNIKQKKSNKGKNATSKNILNLL